MKIAVVPYDPNWPKIFQTIKNDLNRILAGFNPRIEHFGSTAVPGLSAKPVIDILVGLSPDIDMDKTILPMTSNSYIYYQMFTSEVPKRRLFVGLKDSGNFRSFQPVYIDWDKTPHELINLSRLSHVHIWSLDSKDWIRHLAVRDYLIHFPDIRSAYQDLKNRLSAQDWSDGMEYNNAKNKFLQDLEKKALTWYIESGKG